MAPRSGSRTAPRVQDIKDLLPDIKGLSRLIDVYTELGPSGSSSKTIISQESLGHFVNTILPGAYKNVKRIDFERLNRDSRLRLIGIYGERSEIVRLFQMCGAVDKKVSKLLLPPPNAAMAAELRTGIYLFDPPKTPTKRTSIPPATSIRYVIYWPSEGVWDEEPQDMLTRQNRAIFMRYLTCLTDQVRCLMSPKQENALGFEVPHYQNLIDGGCRILREALGSGQELPEETNEGFSHRFCSGEATQAVVTFRLLPGAALHDPSNQEPTPPPIRSEYTQRPTTPNIGLMLWVLDFSERPSNDSELTPVIRIHGAPLEHHVFSSWSIRWVQMLTSKECLLIVDTPERSSIWLFSQNGGFRKNRATYEISSLWGRECAIAVDEQKRIIAFVLMGSRTCIVHQYQMDSKFSTIHTRKLPCNLLEWYEETVPNITHAAFFSGSSDLCLVESSGRMRVVSVSHHRIYPGTVYLGGNPLFVRSCPQSDVVIVVEGEKTSPRQLRIFHRTSFGTHLTGFVRSIPSSFLGTTSFSVLRRTEPESVFMLGLKPGSQELVSVIVDIGTQETAHTSRADEGRGDITSTSETINADKALINCFSEVWERFPVVAAIQRETISPETRQPSSVTFVCQKPNGCFQSYFREMIQTFEKSFQKPTGQRLSSIQVSSSRFDDLEWEAPITSTYLAGEWVAELLCLVPIHIAVTAENRFVPLKDGVLDATLERELLGAEVSKIIDAISLGWYESIFSSYMATKPVKVVSSMGEQSVGKSYTLNHMVDSSFAGSAVRTTEGVWLSVCPTKDCLVVALDCEGVHSIERTPQEDMLLVLFNTALSNLVIFRNNFALSRDVANMFTSFQASTHLFDPTANPRLFKGLLTIVIKDVVDGDKKDIVKEFFAKFSQIVSKEQASNFITVLHNSQLTVIPWSVILSPDFYRLFGKLGKILFNQTTTHDSPGEFLFTLKTLMAKMKAQDWGSLDHTIIKHRVTALTKLLPNVLTVGRLGPETDGDELKNMDNQIPIVRHDTPAVFCLEKDDAERAAALGRLIREWDSDAARRATNDLVQHLQDVAARRITTTREWIQQNVSRFPQDNAGIRVLKRRFDDLSEALLANIQLCLAECTFCRLQCMLNRSHATRKHDCGTSHRCIEICDYKDDHDAEEFCGLPAGHVGRHM